MQRASVSTMQRLLAASMSVVKQRSVWSVGLALLCLLVVILPLVAGPGPVHTRGGGDSPFLWVRLEQLVAGLHALEFPVRWMPDAAYGLGYPFFNYYAALPYYIAAGLRLLGWGPIRALQATQALGFVLAAAAMALLARRTMRHPAAAALAAVAYTCAPFHLANVYVRGDSLSEFYAFVFYPLIVWALLRLRDRPSPARAAWLALSYGGLILTHNLSALMFSPFVGAFALWALFVHTPRRGMETAATQEHGVEAAPRRGMETAATQEHGVEAAPRRGMETAATMGKRWRALAWMVGGGVLGLALAATVWWTAAAELDQVWMGVKDIQTTGFFHYAGHWRSFGASPGARLVQPGFTFDYDAFSSGGTPFAMGAVQAATFALGAISGLFGWAAALLHRTRGRANRSVGLVPFWLLGLALSTFWITPLSEPLWDRVPILPIVQFPWRFLSVQAFFGALLAGELALRLPRPGWVALAASALLTAAAVGSLRPEYLHIAEADVTAERLALFESFTGNVGTTIRGEYLPAGVEPGLRASAVTLNAGIKPPPKVLSGELARATLEQGDAGAERWQIEVSSEQAHLAFYTLHFAGWRASVDGKPAAIEPLPNSGLISLRVPQGRHVVRLRFGRSSVRLAADLVSLGALLATGALLWPKARACAQASPRRGLVFLSSGLALWVTLGALGGAFSALDRPPPANDLSMDFDRQPFLHHNPDGIDYRGVRLLSYDYPDRLAGGSVLNATLQWSGKEPQDNDWEAELQLVSPADPLPLAPLPPPLAQSRQRIDDPTTTHCLSVPEDIAGGPYYLALRVYAGPDPAAEEIRAVNARGEALGTIYLRPMWVDNPRPARGDEALWATFGDRILLRNGVRVDVTGAHWDVGLTWQAITPIAANYTLSLRMLAADGSPLAQRDWAEGPGYGFWPTTAWPAGEWLTDRLRLVIPDGIAPEDAAALGIVLYDRSQPGYPALGTAVVPLGEREYVEREPPVERRVGATFGERALLLGYDMQQLVAGQGADTTSLRLSVYWRALPWDAGPSRPPPDYALFYHLYDPASEQIVAQTDGRPLSGTYPTNAWRAGEVIGDEVTLDLSGVPAGAYRLAVGMVDANGADRATIVTEAGEVLAGGRLILEDRIEVKER